MMNKPVLILSCEHAVNTVPQAYKALFSPFHDLLHTHRGIDFGALAIAQTLQNTLSCDLITASATRLLIDCNRSQHHKHLFSEISNQLPEQEQKAIINHYYLPYRKAVMDCIDQHIAQKRPVLHLSVHSFTPVLNQITRNADIGILYDPRRKQEQFFAQVWKAEIKAIEASYRIRMNYPYTGISDGFTHFLRKKYLPEHYLGIELETNQSLTINEQSLGILKNILAVSLLNAIC